MQTVFFGNFLMQLSAAPTGQRQKETKLKAKTECMYFLLLAFVGDIGIGIGIADSLPDS